MKYLFIFNPKARRYSRKAEAEIVEQAVKILRPTAINVAYTVLHTNQSGEYIIDDFAQQSRDVDCVVAVGGDGTINLVVSALMRSGVHMRVPLGVIPYGTGNNLVRSYGLELDSEKALVTIQQGHVVPLDIGCINQQHYFINASFGLFPYLIARRVTKSLIGWTYDFLRYVDFTPWVVRVRYVDAADRVIELPAQRYIVGTLLNTSYYGSILHMAPDAIGHDGLFDVKLFREVPKLAYPLMFTVILTGKYTLTHQVMTFRARRVEVLSEQPCPFETDGDVVPLQEHYAIEMAGALRLIVPASR